MTFIITSLIPTAAVLQAVRAVERSGYGFNLKKHKIKSQWSKNAYLKTMALRHFEFVVSFFSTLYINLRGKCL